MNIILVLIPVTFLIVAVAVGVFFWAVNHQQFDDLENPGVLPLMEDADVTLPASPNAHATEKRPAIKRQP
ncbi:cbb3-type cytochrome oxidase assembly protein CcoS [Dyella sp. C11]|uniref:cbb3-type cytochrome oxidase assembly protein CcoS n=1 Tax=Dyella sp. C11 TaxID=2126991 RepID=UPI000D649252|nr:cbb3-type cytochrome oxidase assembly protein CcoS [Dyella sp. C11]